MAEFPAELRVKTSAEITLVPMLVQPGDTVIIPLAGRYSQQVIVEMTEQMTEAMPGVKWTFVEGSTMQHALVYRPEDEVKHAPLRRDT